MWIPIRIILAGLGLALAGIAATLAGEANVVGVNVVKSSDGVYRFDVSVRHADRGWHHYADRWEVVHPDGNIPGKRVLAHPHVDEQPFMRSQRVRMSPGIGRVRIRAHDKVHGYGGKEMTVELPE